MALILLRLPAHEHQDKERREVMFSQLFPPLGDSPLPHPSAEASKYFGLGLQGMHGPYFFLEVDSRPKFSSLGFLFLRPGSWEKETFSSPPSPH